MASFERALALAPHDAEVLGHYAHALNYRGEPERALPMLGLAAKLDPLLPVNLRFARGVSLFMLGRHDEAAEVFRTVLHIAPAFGPARYNYVAVLTELGRLGEAKAVASGAPPDSPPVMLVVTGMRRVPFRDEQFRERLFAGLRAVGVLE